MPLRRSTSQRQRRMRSALTQRWIPRWLPQCRMAVRGAASRLLLRRSTCCAPLLLRALRQRGPPVAHASWSARPALQPRYSCAACGIPALPAPPRPWATTCRWAARAQPPCCSLERTTVANRRCCARLALRCCSRTRARAFPRHQPRCRPATASTRAWVPPTRWLPAAPPSWWRCRRRRPSCAAPRRIRWCWLTSWAAAPPHSTALR